MDQNTWKKHRFVIESNGRPSFFLEPENPAAYPAWWLEAGFTELSRYSSSIIPLDGTTAVSPAMKDRILSSGISIDHLDPAVFDNELRAIHALSLKSFSNNFLYTPLAETDFLGAYTKIRNQVDPDLVKLARRDGELIGFVFGIPDLAALQRGEKPALIVKTLAVDPASRAAGLGSVLVDELHRAGERKGYTEAIHALQHETNTSLKITGRQKGTPFRRYAIYAKEL
jgi:predicted N-acetyltransferase YhbS